MKKTPKTNIPAQKPLVKIDEGFYVRPETVSSIEAAPESENVAYPGRAPIRPRVILRHGDGQVRIIPSPSFEAAQAHAAVLSAKINS